MKENKIHPYHQQTLNKVNDLYKDIYDRMISAVELSDSQEETFAYIELSDDIKTAFHKFRYSIKASTLDVSMNLNEAEIGDYLVCVKEVKPARQFKLGDKFKILDKNTEGERCFGRWGLQIDTKKGKRWISLKNGYRRWGLLKTI